MLQNAVMRPGKSSANHSSNSHDRNISKGRAIFLLATMRDNVPRMSGNIFIIILSISRQQTLSVCTQMRAHLVSRPNCRHLIRSAYQDTKMLVTKNSKKTSSQFKAIKYSPSATIYNANCALYQNGKCMFPIPRYICN